MRWRSLPSEFMMAFIVIVFGSELRAVSDKISFFLDYPSTRLLLFYMSFSSDLDLFKTSVIVISLLEKGNCS